MRLERMTKRLARLTVLAFLFGLIYQWLIGSGFGFPPQSEADNVEAIGSG